MSQTHLWTPSEGQLSTSHLTRFQEKISKKYSVKFDNYQSFHAWSVENFQNFWTELFDFFQINYEGSVDPAFVAKDFDSYGWFPNVRINFSQNLLSKGKDQDIAVLAMHESVKEHSLSYSMLKKKAGALGQTLKEYMGKGDVLACYMPNIPETIISMLATSSFGGVFTSTSCDFGIEGVLDRFGQSKPKVLVAATSYSYGGKVFDLREKIAELVKKIPSIKKVILVNFLETKFDKVINVDHSTSFEQAIENEGNLEFEMCRFDDPLYIMYSSGTTGKPKCIVHTVGGVLLQHVKEIGLHVNLKSSESLFYFTTCGWMMWNWLVSGLFFGSRICLYEGSPGFPSLKDFFKRMDDHGIEYFGTSPKFLKALEDSGYNNDFEFSKLKTILSTGAPLLPEQFDYVYQSIKKDVCLSSICGGTDIIGCFVLGNPNLPVYRGEIQSLGLGMDVACLDENANPVIGKEGELVCRKSFPSRPLCFLDDENKEKINKSYFAKYPGIWHHGDFVKITNRSTVEVFGRSDATLNPGGVRIGTSEIYRQTETLSFIEDGLCVGRPKEGDVEVVLFVKLKDGESLDEDRIKLIKKRIRENTTPRHVPAHIYQVAGIPYTRSGKKMEIAISRILVGKALSNIEAVSNPECLSEYEQYR